jgi:hypothetical protein
MPDLGTTFIVTVIMGGLAMKTFFGLVGKFDKEGAVADAAKGGVVRMIGRLFK